MHWYQQVLHLSSAVDVHNCTSVPLRMSVTVEKKDHDIGKCAGHQGDTLNLAASRSTPGVTEGKISKASSFFGIPVDLLTDEGITRKLHVSPGADGTLSGELNIPSLREAVTQAAAGGPAVKRFDISCRNPENDQKGESVRAGDPFVLQACLKVSLVDKKCPLIEIFLEPRIAIENKMPIGLTVRTPMPHTFLGKAHVETREAVGDDNASKEVEHELAPGEFVEVFTPGPSIAFSVRCSDPPVGGRTTDWMEGGWTSIPLPVGSSLPEPLKCVFPFAPRSILDQPDSVEDGGSEFFILESGDDLAKLSQAAEDAPADGAPVGEESSGIPPATQNTATRKVLLMVCNYAVDHTGDVVFEMVDDKGSRRRKSSTASSSGDGTAPWPFSAFSWGTRRITLLPHGTAHLRMLCQTGEGDEEPRRSRVFGLDDIVVGEGGVESTAIRWEAGNSDSGYFAYRRLVDTNQFEVHVIPEFIVFNGSKEKILIKQQNGPEKTIDPGQTAPLRSLPKIGLVVSMKFLGFDGRSAAMRVDSLGLRVGIVKSTDGLPLGSLTVQTLVGNRDSRLVVKLGEVKFGTSLESDSAIGSVSQCSSYSDAMRFRIRWSELHVTLNEKRLLDPDDDSNSDFVDLASAISEEHNEIDKKGTQVPVCTIILQKFTVDWQRTFKDEESAEDDRRDALDSSERSQFSAIVHNVRLLDETPNTDFPVVFDSTSTTSFFDVCIRFRGPLSFELAVIDLFDLNLAHSDGKSQKIIVETSEDFLWRVSDVANRILVSTAGLVGIDLRLEWDEQDGGFIISAKDLSREDFGTEAPYAPPRSLKLFHVKQGACVSI